MDDDVILKREGCRVPQSGWRFILATATALYRRVTPDEAGCDGDNNVVREALADDRGDYLGAALFSLSQPMTTFNFKEGKERFPHRTSIMSERSSQTLPRAAIQGRRVFSSLGGLGTRRTWAPASTSAAPRSAASELFPREVRTRSAEVHSTGKERPRPNVFLGARGCL